MKIPIIYEELLADETLDEEKRAVILERIRLDEDHVAKEKSAAKRRRLKALGDMSILKPDHSLRTDFISTCLPGCDVQAPRDGKKLKETRDILFLSTLLKRSIASGCVLQCAPLSGYGGWIYHPGDRSPAGYAIKQKLSTSGIRRIFRERFFGYRKALGSTIAAAMTFSLGGVVLRPAGSRGDKAFWDFAARLSHPFSRESDTLLTALHTVRLLDFSPDNQGLLVCPIDGCVRAVEAKLTSPNWTWENMVGREWRMALCPLCLGELVETGCSMN